MLTIDSLIVWLGCAVMAYYTIQAILLLFRLIYGYLLDPILDFKSYGKYACITGATDGIGKAYAFEMAARGVDLILISRTESRLQATAEEIKDKYNVEVRTITVDFTRQDIYGCIESQLAGLDIGILINNVGMASEFPRFFVECEPKFIEDSVNCNLLSAAMMSRIVYPSFVEKSKGLLINVSSTAGTLPGAMAAVYCATKHGVQVLSDGIGTEAMCIDPEICVQDVAPCFVATKLSGQVEVPFHVLSPAHYVRCALATIGRLRKTPGCISHQIESLFLSILPRQVLGKIMLLVMKRVRKSKKSQ